MPHLTLEYSENVSERPNLAKLHTILLKQGICSASDIKSRAISYDTFYVGDGDPKNKFVHLTVAMLPGRSQERRSDVGRALHQALTDNYSCDKPESITVEIRELDAETYHKTCSTQAT